MKRVLSLLTVFMLALSLVVPVGAANLDIIYGGNYAPDARTVWDEEAYPYGFMCKTMDDKYLIYSTKPFRYGANGSVYLTETAPYKQYVADGDVWKYSYSTESKDTDLPVIDYQATIFWSNVDIGNDGTTDKTFAGSAPVYPICTGLACPANDVNGDGICDDCGRMIQLVSTYPRLPSVDGSYLHSVVLKRDDGYFYMALTSDSPYSVSGAVGENYLITVADENEVTYTTYKCTDGVNWVHNSTGKGYSLSVGSPSSTLLESTFDWTKDGEHFFPVPPTLAEVTETALGEMTVTLGGTMKVLVLSGVGLMALLVVLSLFGKRSLLFLR